MVERNSNLLLNGTVDQAGVNYESALNWYGGDLTVSASGDFSGMTLDLVFCTRLPKLEGSDTLADVLSDADWIELHTFTEGGTYSAPLNPCLLAVKATTPNPASDVRVLIS